MAIQPVTMDKVSPITPTPSATLVSNNGHTKNIQSQITSKQQHLKQVSSDDTITATEKEEKRRELQREIDELNRKLELRKQEQKEKAEEAAQKQKQAEAQKAEMQKKEDAKLSEKEAETGKATEARLDEQKTDSLKEDQKKADMSVKEIQQMLSADYQLQKTLVQEQSDKKIESTIHVLKSEIRQDKAYGTDTTQKEAELETLKNKENFWSEAQKTEEAQKQTQEQTSVQTTLNANAKIVTDQM